MKKIVNFNVFDIIPFQSGILYAKKEVLESGAVKVAFSGFDLKTMNRTAVTKSVYIRNKFGIGSEPIADSLGDYVSCDVGVLPNKNTVVVYPTGEMGIFDKKGRNIWTGDLFYHESPIQSLAVNGHLIWCVVPEQNAIISYSIPHKKFDMRIGGDSSTTFDVPTSLSLYDNQLYICNCGSYKIRIINLNDYSVSDYKQFDEPVYKYLRSCGREIVSLESGVYVL